jgi:hypothetical protein
MNKDPNIGYGLGNDIDQIYEKIKVADLYYKDTMMKNFLDYSFI